MIKGIDCSHWQGNINWSKVPKDLSFVILKVSGGDAGLYKDAMFETYRTGVRNLGIGLGYYHFAGGIDPVKEADWFLKCVGDILPGEVLALDFEIHIADPIGFCTKFVERIHDKVGFWPLFYSYSSLAALFTKGSVMNCGLWIADPSDKPRIGAWKNWAIWQYTVMPSGQYPGITTSIDRDYFNGTIEQFKKYGKPTPIQTTPDPVIPVPVVTAPVIPVETPMVELPVTPSVSPVDETVPKEVTYTLLKKLINLIKSLWEKAS